MCDFHSVLGVAFSEDRFELRHDPGNSHSKMAGELKNKDNRKPIIFEAEWNGQGDLPPDKKLIRNHAECQERLVKMIRNHYIKLKEALTTGKHLDENGYFRDTKKWWDVWNEAIRLGVAVKLPAIFLGSLDLRENAKLDASALTSIGGYLYLRENAKLDASALTSIGGYLDLSENAKLDASALTSIGGYLDLSENAKLDASALTSIGGSMYLRKNAKLDASALTSIGDYLDLSENAKLDASALTSIGGSMYLRKNAKLDAANLKTVNGKPYK